ncbi:MAG: DNA-binding response regulator [Acidobacteria bacterium 13_1_20CM_2_57_8]|nr:MAG: DNA-binding response regulator [Acidobacteria bacterium 13_1_40CM_4_58_4]OLD57853.1 MAG: DNA-binding response regulator [Acidobacteria bacterium 13_1_40CM_2_56_5]OLE73748.1 MAG: DNA-binding response regulator [Acidobacteria bacterium 13_1_20CM_2_57_8]PYS29045.1 MAG: DNA-binding response regulator [Acidobacteriota bacterium]
MERVLIVDDDPDIQKLVSYNLGQAGFEVTTAGTGRNALEAVQKHPPDLIILDLMLPDVDGMEVCRTLRQRDSSRHIPIIMLTARSEEIDRVIGFELGADDYVMKPFSPRELVLRVKSIFRRTKDERSDMLRIGNIQLYPDRHQCFVGNEQVTLTAKEFDLLYELMRARGNVLTRDVLMDKVWGYHGEATSRTLDTHVRRVREKLGNEGLHVETVRGVGYRMGSPAEHG